VGDPVGDTREVGPSCTETQAYPVVCIVRSLCIIPEGTRYLYVQRGVGLRANRLSTSAGSLPRGGAGDSLHADVSIHVEH
jgi:hypothetical protein